MRSTFTALSLVALLAACDGNPFVDEVVVPDDSETVDPLIGDTTPGDNVFDPENGINSDRTLPPGSASPSATTGIVRYEAEADNGNGFAQSFVYDSATDTFSVDNLAFDGNNTYTRDNQVGSIGPFAIYENANPIVDTTNGRSIPQFAHKAIYGVSTSGATEFALVRTGAYVDYGFGGFIYQRNGTVSFPTGGQAIFTGDYAALRDFQGTAGIQYVTGDMIMAIDFQDFNDGAGVRGEISNRVVFDADGSDSTAATIGAINAHHQASITSLPTMSFIVGPGVADTNGEIIGRINSFITNDAGAVVELEQGNYYAIVAGTDASEIVGVIVTEGDLSSTVTARDTGGFILYR